MGGWHCAPTYAPTSIIWVYLCKYAYEHIAAQFYTIKLVRFLGKKVCQKYQNFIRPYKLSQTPLDQQKKQIKSQTLFWRVLRIQRILLIMVNHSLVSHFQKELYPNPTQPKDI